MIDVAKKLLEKFTPLPVEIIEKRANCFNAIQLCWADCTDSEFIGPEEFVAYMQRSFIQLKEGDIPSVGDVSIVWSRSNSQLPIGSIWIDDLRKGKEGYPFGLIIEHSFLLLGNDLIFQKRDPTKNGPYEIISESEAIAPYKSTNGFEITRHRRV